LPRSFALDVTAFPKQDGANAWKMGHIVVYVAGISLSLSLPFIAIAFSINPLVESAWFKGKKPKGRGSFNKSSIRGWSYRFPGIRQLRKQKADDLCGI